jgi:hypothetical protein
VSLGSIYEQDDGGPRGRDLTAQVDVPQWALGAPHAVQVPLDLPTASALVRRTIGPGDQGTTITLNLPEGVPDGVTLRLRGLGEAHAGGRSGDLYLQVQLVDTPRPAKTFGAAPSAAAEGMVLPMLLGAVVALTLGVLGWLALR